MSADSEHIALGPGAEFETIAKMVRRWGPLARGIGDDAALLTLPRGERLVASTDSAIDGVHFRHSWLTPREIGYRAVTAALSDLAAMAALPLGVLVSVQVPKSARGKIASIADGIGDAVRAAGTVIVGGNLSAGDVLGLTTTVLGHAFAPLTRAGARPGDFVYVTGELGGPAAAIRALASRRKPARTVRDRFARPGARIASARWLAARGAVAAIDISDGLLADASHLAAASKVRIELESVRIPVTRGATLTDALHGGEEYELLVASRSPLTEPQPADGDAVRTRLTLLGRVREGAGVTVDGKRIAGKQGHDHFSR